MEKEHLYIACYAVVRPPDGKPKFLSSEEIYAKDDDEAIEKSENLAEALDAIENARPDTFGKTLNRKSVALMSIRDQVTRRTVYSIGYTLDE